MVAEAESNGDGPFTASKANARANGVASEKQELFPEGSVASDLYNLFPLSYCAISFLLGQCGSCL